MLKGGCPGYGKKDTSKGRDLPGYRKQAKGQGALTLRRLQREGRVETWKESDKGGALTRWELQQGTKLGH